MEYIALNKKEKEAKKNVMNNLYKLKDYIENISVSNIEDDISFSSSLIIVNKTTKDDNRILRAVQKRLDIEKLYDRYAKYMSYLENYDSELRDLIEYKYFMNYEIREIAWKCYTDRKKISYLVNKACLILAYYDNEINFSINDLSNYIGRSYSESYKIQDTVHVLIAEHSNATTDTINVVANIFNFLSSDLETIYKNKKDNRKNYLKIIYSIAYMHPEIKFDKEHFEAAAARTSLARKMQNKLIKANKLDDEKKKKNIKAEL